jgi:hypothetical protein
VSLLNVEARNSIYAKRGMLRRANANVFISEDLIPTVSNLFYKTRRRCAELRLPAPWTNNGMIFVKRTIDSIPFKIFEESDLETKLPNPA